MVDKNLETDREATLHYERLDAEVPNNNFDVSKHEKVLIDLIEQKRAADISDKASLIFNSSYSHIDSSIPFQICPMCGKFYTQDILFEEFQEHVESHFHDDSDVELSMDQTFELVSNTIGNF